MSEEITKREELRRREEEENSTIWEIIREKPVLDLDWDPLMHVARKRMKAYLQQWGQRVADEFWQVHWGRRKGEGVPEEYGSFACRIQERGWTIYVQWYRLEARGTKERHVRKMISLPTPKVGYRMKMSEFAKAKPWEMEAIVKAENEFEKVRKCAERLEKIRHAVVHFRRSLPDGLTGEFDFVDGLPDDLLGEIEESA